MKLWNEPMTGRLLASAVLSLALMQGAAFAQANKSSDKAMNSTAQNQSAQSLPQQIRDKLKSQGYSDVKVVPGSYIVGAKDKDGDPVTMVIGPHSTAVFTTVSTDSASTTGGDSASTTGSGQSDSSNQKNSSSK